MVARPYCLLISLGLLLLLLPIFAVSAWYLTARHAEHSVDMASDAAYVNLLSHIEDSARLLLPIKLSASRLAGVISSYLSGSLWSFDTLQSQVARDMFLLYSAGPPLSQISYLGEDGLFFSYYKEANKTFSLFANVSHSSFGNAVNGSSVYLWYKQLVDDTGKRDGEATALPPFALWNSSWFYSILNSENGYTSWGLGWGKSQEPLFLCMAPIKDFLPRGQRGIVSLGVPLKVFTSFISSINLHGGDIYLATEDGHLLAQSGSPVIGVALRNGTVLVQTSKSENDASPEADSYLLCKMNNYSNRTSKPVSVANVNIQGTRYVFYCAPLELAGVRLASILAFPYKRNVNLDQRLSKIAWVLACLMLLCTTLVSSFFVLFICRATRREVFLCAALINQIQATRQAERKSTNKSIAFASASHDVRTSLAAIIGLIDLCRGDVSRRSELESNLAQMSTCASNLLWILNSVLDTSKIEAGKMQLEEVEFDLPQVLEEVVDMFYVVALKKGIEVVLDSCDSSIMESSLVKGDCGRLKQILCNLLSNGIKFTPDGHVVVRAWVNKPSLESSIFSSNNNNRFLKLWGCLSCCVCKHGGQYKDLGSLCTVNQNPNLIEFVCEVSDTGKGIPKDKHKFVFENFVQVKESVSEGSNGTGLGLGIVQSLVRLMGGEISIVDKEPGEKGTCFRFNIFLRTVSSQGFAEGGQMRNQLHQTSGFGTDVQHLGLNIRNPSSSRSIKFSGGIELEGIHALFLIQGEAGRRIAKKWMELHGVKAWDLNQWENLYPTLEKIKREAALRCFSTSGSFGSVSLGSCSSNSGFYNVNGREQHASRSENDGDNHLLTPNIVTNRQCGMASFRGMSTCILIVIDMSCGPFLEICSVLVNFSKRIHNSRFKVVWLANADSPSVDLETLKSKNAPCDLILQKPFHGSRLYAVLRLLREFRGKSEAHPSETSLEIHVQEVPNNSEYHASTSGNVQSFHHGQRVGLEDNLNRDDALSGMNVLVAEDNAVLRKLAVATLSRLGATTECCENGEEAVKLVCEALRGINGSTNRVSDKFPYDLILMDCEMPIMDGYGATRQIRLEERRYGLHVPIIALTAYAMADEAIKSIQAGMDFHLMKPLTADCLLDAIHTVHQN